MTDCREPQPDAQVRDVWIALLQERPAHLAFLRRRLSSAADAEDLLQLAWMRAARHLDDLRSDERLSAWFWRILRNTLTDEHRRLGREQAATSELLAEERSVSIGEGNETCGCSLGVLEQIRPEYREVLRRADVNEEPIEQVADELGITVNNASVRLHRARKAMRDALLENCGTASLRGCQDCGCEDAVSPR